MHQYTIQHGSSTGHIEISDRSKLQQVQINERRKVIKKQDEYEKE